MRSKAERRTRVTRCSTGLASIKELTSPLKVGDSSGKSLLACTEMPEVEQIPVPNCSGEGAAGSPVTSTFGSFEAKALPARHTSTTVSASGALLKGRENKGLHLPPSFTEDQRSRCNKLPRTVLLHYRCPCRHFSSAGDQVQFGRSGLAVVARARKWLKLIGFLLVMRRVMWTRFSESKRPSTLPIK